MKKFITKLLFRFLKDKSGVAAIEFAFLGPLLVILLLGVFDVGTMVYERTDLHSAARSGAQYFMAGGTDLAVAKSIVEASWTDRFQNSSLIVEKCCKCAGIDVPCGELCPDETVPDILYIVEITSDFEGLFSQYNIHVLETVRAR
jgi:Flp pilus assembly pilin Flp